MYYDTLQSVLLCDSVIQTQLLLYPLPLDALPADTFYCKGDSVNLNALNPGSGYVWNTGEFSQEVVVQQAGLYSVTITNSDGCRIVDSVQVQEIPLPDIHTAPADPLICIDSSVQITCPGSYSYQWDPLTGLSVLNDSTMLASPEHTTQYTITGTDSYGCKNDTSIIVLVKFPPESALSDSISSCVGFPIILNPGYPSELIHYVWSEGDTTMTIQVLEAGIYWVRLSNIACSITDTITISECPEIWIPNVFTPNNDGSNETFHPKGDALPGYEMLIYNRWGVLLFQTVDFYEGWDGNFQGQACSDGTYYYIIRFQSPNYLTNNEIILRSGSLTLLR